MINSVFYKSIFEDFAFLVLRVFTGVLLIHHGFEKLNDINNFADAFVRPLHLPFKDCSISIIGIITQGFSILPLFPRLYIGAAKVRKIKVS